MYKTVQRTCFLGLLLTVFWIGLSGCINGNPEEKIQPASPTSLDRNQFIENKPLLWLMGLWRVTTNVSIGNTDASILQYLFIKSVNINPSMSPYMTDGYVLDSVAIITNKSGTYSQIPDIDRMYINARSFLLGTLNPIAYKYAVSADLKVMYFSNEVSRLVLIKTTNDVETYMVSNILKNLKSAR